ncbi:hypothetical protein [Hymenobacter sp. B1770]|uniref:hypothetical protein n=1 Tax=Hymenobacter sp. B1770 TaxID=1718788 RepID=UPI003CF3A25D
MQPHLLSGWVVTYRNLALAHMECTFGDLFQAGIFLTCEVLRTEAGINKPSYSTGSSAGAAATTRLTDAISCTTSNVRSALA